MTRFKAFSWLLLFAAIAFLGAVLLQLQGCTTVQRVADGVAYVAGAPVQPTSQPTTQQAQLDAGRAAVQIGGQLYPPVKTIAGVVGSAALLVGSWAGRLSGKASANDVVAEVADDVKEFKDPHTPFSAKATKLLIDLGRIDVVQVTPKQP